MRQLLLDNKHVTILGLFFLESDDPGIIFPGNNSSGINHPGKNTKTQLKFSKQFIVRIFRTVARQNSLNSQIAKT